MIQKWQILLTLRIFKQVKLSFRKYDIIWILKKKIKNGKYSFYYQKYLDCRIFELDSRIIIFWCLNIKFSLIKIWNSRKKYFCIIVWASKRLADVDQAWNHSYLSINFYVVQTWLKVGLVMNSKKTLLTCFSLASSVAQFHASIPFVTICRSTTVLSSEAKYLEA